MASLGERLKELRTGRHLTQQQLADKIGVAKNTVSVYENGIRRPSYEVLEAISDYFNVDVSYILGIEDVSERLLTADELCVIDRMKQDEVFRMRVIAGIEQDGVDLDRLLSPDEQEVLFAYRESIPAIKNAIRGALGLEKEESSLRGSSEAG